MESNTIQKFEGQIIYKRKLGKKLVFLYLLCEDKTEVEVMLKECQYIDTTALGQIISVEGNFVEQYGKSPFVPINITVLKERENHYEVNNIRKVMIANTNKPIESRALCKSFRNNNPCNLLDCKFRHFLLEGEEEKLKACITRKQIAYEYAHQGDPLLKDTKLKKLQRHKIFAEFLIENFGLENIRKGHVLDIAGGKGI